MNAEKESKIKKVICLLIDYSEDPYLLKIDMKSKE